MLSKPSPLTGLIFATRKMTFKFRWWGWRFRTKPIATVEFEHFLLLISRGSCLRNVDGFVRSLAVVTDKFTVFVRPIEMMAIRSHLVVRLLII